jgi:hypothetical protein
MDFLFGEGQYGLRILLAIFVVLALIGLLGWLVRRFGSERLGATSTRSRQPRLAVIDAAPVDGRRRLLLIRRDNVEHLLMIGGPTDIVVEPNIVRAAAARDTTPSRAPGLPDSMPRSATPNEAIGWPSQHDPAQASSPRPPRQPAVTEEPALRQAETEPLSPPPLRLQRQRPVTEEPALRHPEAEPPSPPPLRPQRQRFVTEEPKSGQPEAEPPSLSPPARHQARPADSLAGLAAELSRQPSTGTPPPRAPRERDAAREFLPPRAPPQPPSVPSEVPFTAAADHNLADMAQRLEAALRRAPRPDTLAESMPEAPPEPRSKMVAPAAIPAGPPGPEPPREAALQREPALTASVAAETRLVHNETKARKSDELGRKTSVYDSLEQEMASLLGRPPKS